MVQRYYPNKVILNIFDARFRIKPIITCNNKVVAIILDSVYY
ncbi:hypothetical protein [Acinetobacter phage Ab69]|nr:hypothetical protein [Acinetobacter phage Ab69]